MYFNTAGIYVPVDYVPSNELPLQDCHVSLSSVGDVLVMAWNTKMIIFGCKYKYHLSIILNFAMYTYEHFLLDM